jgi:hypothetical protein
VVESGSSLAIAPSCTLRLVEAPGARVMVRLIVVPLTVKPSPLIRGKMVLSP